MYKDFIFENYDKYGYQDRVIIQAKNLDEAIKKLRNDYGFANWYLCVE